jgi:hypothetical protein
MTDLIKLAFDLGRHAKALEEYNRECDRLRETFPQFFNSEHGADDSKKGENTSEQKQTNINGKSGNAVL